MRLKALYRLYKESILRNFNRGIQFIVDVVYDRINNNIADSIGFILNILSIVFSQIIKIRYFLYDKRLLKNSPLGCLVIVVGNITVGGTGKTPVVEKLAKTLQQNGRKVGIISRGYKSKNESLSKKILRFVTNGAVTPPKIVSDGKNVLLGSKLAGDEPYMLANNLPGVVVVCDKNRVKAGYFAIKDFGCDTLVLDDGFQYLKLKGSLNICLVDSTNPFGNEHLLPRGILREPLHRLSKADYILITKTKNIQQCEELHQTIRNHNSLAKIIYCKHTPRFLVDIKSKEEKNLDFIKEKKVAVFSGIAYPESFEGTIKEQGAEIIYTKRFLDHHRFSAGEIKTVFMEAFASGAEMILTTEKDAVRLPKIFPKIPLYYLRLEIDLLSHEDDFDSLARRICLPQKDKLYNH